MGFSRKKKPPQSPPSPPQSPAKRGIQKFLTGAGAQKDQAAIKEQRAGELSKAPAAEITVAETSGAAAGAVERSGSQPERNESAAQHKQRDSSYTQPGSRTRGGGEDGGTPVPASREEEGEIQRRGREEDTVLQEASTHLWHKVQAQAHTAPLSPTQMQSSSPITSPPSEAAAECPILSSMWDTEEMESEDSSLEGPSLLTPHRGARMQGIEAMRQIGALSTYIKTIPTKEDMEAYVTRLENVYKSELSIVRQEVQQVDSRVSSTENALSELTARVNAQDAIIQTHTNQIQNLADSLEDAENRNRRNNIRVRGIPEVVEHRNLESALRHIFNSILDVPNATPLELDRAHRALGPVSGDPHRPRDVICRVHRYKIKEEIMQKAWERQTITFQNSNIQILPDLARVTLQKRRALQPLLTILRQRNINYTWGFPFRLQVRREGQTVVLRNPGDIPTFTTALDIPRVEITEWPKAPTGAFTARPPGPRPRPQRMARGRREWGPREIGDRERRSPPRD